MLPVVGANSGANWRAVVLAVPVGLATARSASLSSARNGKAFESPWTLHFFATNRTYPKSMISAPTIDMIQPLG